MTVRSWRAMAWLLVLLGGSRVGWADAPSDPASLHAAYEALLAQFSEDRQGFGIDTFLQAVDHQPMTYGLVLSAEAIRLKREPNDESRRRVNKAVHWLLDNRDLDGDVKPGWGLPQPWDAWADGTTNPPNQPYTITTSICLNGLLDALAVDDFWTDAQRKEICNVMREVVLRWCREVWSDGYGGGFFWYSPSPDDAAFGINAPAMFLGSMARLLAEQPDALTGEDRQLVEDRADALARAVVQTVQLRNGLPFWRYAPLPNRFDNDRPNDLVHQAYILWGVETYRDRGGRVKLPWTQDQAVESMDRFWRDGQIWEYAPDDPGTSINARPRLWGIGFAMGFYAKWGDAERAGRTFQQIDKEYGHWPELRFRPGSGKATFYPRHAAHVLLGMALVAYPETRPERIN